MSPTLRGRDHYVNVQLPSVCRDGVSRARFQGQWAGWSHQVGPTSTVLACHLTSGVSGVLGRMVLTAGAEGSRLGLAVATSVVGPTAEVRACRGSMCPLLRNVLDSVLNVKWCNASITQVFHGNVSKLAMSLTFHYSVNVHVICYTGRTIYGRILDNINNRERSSCQECITRPHFVHKITGLHGNNYF